MRAEAIQFSDRERVLAALGVVFGDIGTSPLYAFREAAVAAGGSNELIVLGVLSLIFWSLVIAIAIKYVTIVLRLDNGGEGGVLALATLLDLPRARTRGRIALLIVALAGAAMLFGDGVITPAISVLSAVEGLRVALPALEAMILPVTCVVIASLFLGQRAGSENIGRVFGPVMLLWFVAIGVLGAWGIASNPNVVQAIDPSYGLELLAERPGHAAAILAAVFLVVTGGEALYADLGQFGRHAITSAWFFIAMPGLLLSYFGQGALLLANPAALDNPFFRLAPEPFQVPLVILAAVATIIASQAVITGVFSLSRQAMDLNLLVRLRVRFTSSRNEHQVYIAVINTILAVLTLSVVIVFRSSSDLAGAYGLAVAFAMVTTTVLVGAELRRRIRKYKLRKYRTLAIVAGGAIVTIDSVFLVSNTGKIAAGGWLPLIIGSCALLLMLAWRYGRARLAAQQSTTATSIGRFARELEKQGPTTPVPIVAMVQPGAISIPTVSKLEELLQVFPNQLVMTSVWVATRPRVAPKDRLRVLRLSERVARIDLRVGYLQRINVPSLIAPTLTGLGIDPDTVIYLCGHDRLLVPQQLRSLRDFAAMIFVFLSRNAVRAVDRFDLPPSRTLEIGVQRQL